MISPVHPPFKEARIPVLITKPDGSTQTYWVSLKRFILERNKGTPIQRMPRKTHKDVAVPEQKAPDWMMEFIENLEDFKVAGLKIDGNEYDVELIAEVRMKKNGKIVGTYPIQNINIEQIARAILQKLMKG